MKPRNMPEKSSQPFTGAARHYHRAGSKPNSSWDQWVDGKLPTDRKISRRLWKGILAFLGIAALIAIGIGLYVELG
ncbi:MAG: hypothetical protein EAZ42_10415 [Verrucomicrobia bacterium]|nr:MAG: hypothetical protein EAZ42_10415 [Verrucomicrobiota bacterium]